MARKFSNAEFGATPSAPAAPFWTRLFDRVGEGLREWVERRQDRAAFLKLRSLDDRQLRDIGLTRADVEEAANLPVWQSASEEVQRRSRLRRRGERFW